MTASWTITEGAVWDWTYSSFAGNGNTPGDNTVFGNTSSAQTVRVEGTGGPTSLTTFTEEASETGTFYTSTIITTETTIRTTTQTIDEGEGIFATVPSASWDADESSIDIFEASVAATASISISTESNILTTVSAGTYLKPLDIPLWIDAPGVGDNFLYAPTVYAWTSAAGYSQPTATDETSLPSVAELSYSGQATAFPPPDIFQIPSTSLYQSTGVTETWQSESLTWTRQTQTATTLTRAVAGAPITRSTQEYQTTLNTTRTSSGVFVVTHAYNQGNVDDTISWASWWQSTALAETIYIDSNQTLTGSTTTTVLVSSAAKTFLNRLDENQAGQQPLAPFERSFSALRGVLSRGSYSHFYTGNAGFATNPTQEPQAALSHAAQSFVLPAQSFQTVLLQRGVTAPRPNQTRSSTSSNSTTLWSLGFSALTLTTISSNQTTTESTTSSYALSAAGPTLWSSSSRSIGSTVFTAAGGAYPSNSFFAGGGLFTATAGASEFTGTAITAGTNATAFQALPHFVPETGNASVVTVAPLLPTVAEGFLGLRKLGFPLTA
jgi:hypothetical protein